LAWLARAWSGVWGWRRGCGSAGGFEGEEVGDEKVEAHPRRRYWVQAGM